MTDSEQLLKSAERYASLIASVSVNISEADLSAQTVRQSRPNIGELCAGTT